MLLLIVDVWIAIKQHTNNYEMSSNQINEYGSVSLGYESDRTVSAPSSPRSAGHHEEEEEVVAVVAVASKTKTIKPKAAPKKTKKQQKEDEEEAQRADSKTGRTVAEVSADLAAKRGLKKAVAEHIAECHEGLDEEVAVAVAPASPSRVIADDVEVVDVDFLQKMIDDAVAPLALRLKAIEDAEDAQPLGDKPKRKGYYTVADGDEELCRVRQQNKDLRKEIEAKAETNRKLSEQLLGDEGSEVVRLKAMNLALRKERDGAREGRKVAVAQAERYRQMLIDAGVALE